MKFIFKLVVFIVTVVVAILSFKVFTKTKEKIKS